MNTGSIEYEIGVRAIRGELNRIREYYVARYGIKAESWFAK